MAENDREAIKKDLVMILNLNSKLNYEKKDDIKKIHSAIMQKNMFKTALGMKYVKRLEQIGNGTDRFKGCVLCGSDLDNKSLVCTGCAKKYQAVQSLTEKPSQAPDKSTNYQKQFSQASEWSSAIKNKVDALSSGKAEKTDNSTKTEAKEKFSRKKAVVLGLVIAALWIFAEVVGLGNLFAFCTLAAMCLLVYKCIKRQKKRNTIIACVAFFLLSGIFGNNGRSESRDIANMLGKTEKEVIKIWGEPDYMKAGFPAYYDGYYYICFDKKIQSVTLENENKNNSIMGISIGDREEDVNRIMKKKGAVQVDTNYIFLKRYRVNDNIEIEIYFDEYDFTVKEVSAY